MTDRVRCEHIWRHVGGEAFNRVCARCGERDFSTHEQRRASSNSAAKCSCWLDGFAGSNPDPDCAVHATRNRVHPFQLRRDVGMALADTFQALRYRHKRDLLGSLPPHWALEMADKAIQLVKESQKP